MHLVYDDDYEYDDDFDDYDRDSDILNLTALNAEFAQFTAV